MECQFADCPVFPHSSLYDSDFSSLSLCTETPKRTVNELPRITFFHSPAAKKFLFA